ncbi:hypothetical protein EDD86DRAFT_208431 [Gorgonomyces haynaldii]|nr:hypothetical protein EDD86DRAFT_208431 [Gorgonomyces haynaldii]
MHSFAIVLYLIYPLRKYQSWDRLCVFASFAAFYHMIYILHLIILSYRTHDLELVKSLTQTSILLNMLSWTTGALAMNQFVLYIVSAASGIGFVDVNLSFWNWSLSAPSLLLILRVFSLTYSFLVAVFWCVFGVDTRQSFVIFKRIQMLFLTFMCFFVTSPLQTYLVYQVLKKMKQLYLQKNTSPPPSFKHLEYAMMSIPTLFYYPIGIVSLLTVVLQESNETDPFGLLRSMVAVESILILSGTYFSFYLIYKISYRPKQPRSVQIVQQIAEQSKLSVSLKQAQTLNQSEGVQ